MTPDEERTCSILKEIRDSTDTTLSEKLRAIELLLTMESRRRQSTACDRHSATSPTKS